MCRKFYLAFSANANVNVAVFLLVSDGRHCTWKRRATFSFSPVHTDTSFSTPVHERFCSSVYSEQFFHN